MSIGSRYAHIVDECARKLEEILKRAKDKGAETIVLYYSDAIPRIVDVAFIHKRLTESDLLSINDLENLIMAELSSLSEEVLRIACRLYDSGIDADNVISEVAEKIGLNCIGYV